MNAPVARSTTWKFSCFSSRSIFFSPRIVSRSSSTMTSLSFWSTPGSSALTLISRSVSLTSMRGAASAVFPVRSGISPNTRSMRARGSGIDRKAGELPYRNGTIDRCAISSPPRKVSGCRRSQWGRGGCAGGGSPSRFLDGQCYEAIASAMVHQQHGLLGVDRLLKLLRAVRGIGHRLLVDRDDHVTWLDDAGRQAVGRHRADQNAGDVGRHTGLPPQVVAEWCQFETERT